MVKQKLTACLATLLLFLGLAIYNLQPALAADSAQGVRLFQVHCAGCHPAGGNIIRRGKTLKQKALHRNGMDSMDAIVDLATNGKNNMSAFSDRLSPEEIEAVSAYVLQQAATGWR
jgi:cytochrome c6